MNTQKKQFNGKFETNLRNYFKNDIEGYIKYLEELLSWKSGSELPLKDGYYLVRYEKDNSLEINCFFELGYFFEGKWLNDRLVMNWLYVSTYSFLPEVKNGK